MEGRPPFGRHLAHVDHGLRIVGIDVEDGGVDDACHVRAVRRGAGESRVGGKSNLVVDHDVYGAWRREDTRDEDS